MVISVADAVVTMIAAVETIAIAAVAAADVKNK